MQSDKERNLNKLELNCMYSAQDLKEHCLKVKANDLYYRLICYIY